MTDNHISNGSFARAVNFAGHWIAGAGHGSRSTRRRLMAVLRMAHRVLGLGRKNMGLGTLGVGGSVRSAGAIGGVGRRQFMARK
ncbi:hypothetical protein, partial [Mesorhizobium sp. LNHC252B00]|uniref:hypothetical protein n=1 Tax=Mesorhizobium sp. LNHC252B00 TaxID=1287252 RepID=UPI000519AB6D